MPKIKTITQYYDKLGKVKVYANSAEFKEAAENINKMPEYIVVNGILYQFNPDE